MVAETSIMVSKELRIKLNKIKYQEGYSTLEELLTDFLNKYKSHKGKNAY